MSTCGIYLVAARRDLQYQKARIRDDATSVLLAALTRIIDKTRVRIEHVGIHAYRVRGWPMGQKEQVRIARLRLANTPNASTIEWSYGKGVVGLCWKEQDLPVWWSPHPTDVAMGLEEWEGLTSEQRLGFTYSEWQTARRYAGIVAVPILRERDGKHQYVGCVTLDSTDGQDYRTLQNSRVAVERELNYAATVIAESIKKNA